MNRFLFDTLTFLNGFLAVILIALFTFLGWFHPAFLDMRPVGLIVGALTGITAAAVVCGTIAFLALIERHLRTIAERRPTVAGSSERYDDRGRQEPRL